MAKTKKRMGSRGAVVGIIIGVALMILSYIISVGSSSVFFLEVHSEIFGAGLVIALVSTVFLGLKLRISG